MLHWLLLFHNMLKAFKNSYSHQATIHGEQLLDNAMSHSISVAFSFESYRIIKFLEKTFLLHRIRLVNHLHVCVCKVVSTILQVNNNYYYGIKCGLSLFLSFPEWKVSKKALILLWKNSKQSSQFLSFSVCLSFTRRACMCQFPFQFT